MERGGVRIRTDALNGQSDISSRVPPSVVRKWNSADYQVVLVFGGNLYTTFPCHVSLIRCNSDILGI
jgi:hypothetical protein